MSLVLKSVVNLGILATKSPIPVYVALICLYIFIPSTRQCQGYKYRNDIPLFCGRDIPQLCGCDIPYCVGVIYPCSVGFIDILCIRVCQCVDVVKAVGSKFVSFIT